MALRNARLLRAKGMAHCEEEGHIFDVFLYAQVLERCRKEGLAARKRVSKSLILMLRGVPQAQLVDASGGIDKLTPRPVPRLKLQPQSHFAFSMREVDRLEALEGQSRRGGELGSSLMVTVASVRLRQVPTML